MKRTMTLMQTVRTATVCLASSLAACGGSSSDNVTASTASSLSPKVSTGVLTGASANSADPIFFSASNYSVAQDSGSVSLVVVRVGDVSSAASVAYSTTDGSAIAGGDYAATAGTLQWAENDSTAKTIAVPITGSGPFSGNKTFSVALSGPSASAQIATPDSAVVTISGKAGMAAGTLLLSATAYTVTQNTGELAVTVNRINGSSGAASVQYATSDATAVAGTDYTAASGTLNWADGDATSKTFSIAVSNATSFSGDKVFAVSLSNPMAGAALGNPGNATVTITGTNSASMGTLHFAAVNYAVAQGAGSLIVSVDRLGGSSGQVTVGYSTVDATAIAGKDFTAASGSLTWVDGDVAAKTISIAISNATPFSGSKTFSVSLAGPGNGATISNPGTAAVIIAGDAAPAMGGLQLSAATYAVAQSAGSVSVNVQRSGGVNGTVSVAYKLVNGSAVAGVDFSAGGGVLQWADGDGAPKTVAVSISGATPFSGTKSFSIELSNASGGAVLGSPSAATVAITGDASVAVGTLQISASKLAVAQNAGTLAVTVNRTGGSATAASVDYATADVSALAGTDYSAGAGTLNWADGDAKSKTISIKISTAVPFAGTRSFAIALSKPSAGAALSSPSTAAVTITGSASAAVGKLQLAAGAETVAQSAGSTAVTVTRSGGSAGAASVAYATSNGTAVAGTHFTATNGTLNWADGDTAQKTITVDINAAAAFSGTKTFSIALSNPGGGATLGNPSSATVTLTGSGSGSGGSGPSVPNNLLMTHQTGTSISLAWSAATPGSNPIDHYRIYRNDTAYDTVNSLSYTDNGATNATDGGYGSGAFSAADSIYAYAVSAVDSAGNEGPKTTQTSFNVYADGVFNWQGDYSYSASANYRDTSGSPESGPYDIEVNISSAYGGFQPYSGNAVPLWDLQAGAFNYIVMDLKPTISNQSWHLGMISRLPPGDVYPWASVDLGSYGPAPVVGKWATYKIPLSKLTIGKTSFQGSISGDTLTVTSVSSGVGVDAGGFITGNGVKPGTYITGHNAKGGPGTYTISPSQDVPSTSMTEQRTGVYKFDLSDQSGASNNHFYVDNVKFTAQ